jgi:hypothetical protein
MARTKKLLWQEQPLLSTHTYTLSEDVLDVLRHLSQDASDFLGRTVSDSAIIRALIRQIDQQGPPAVDELFIQVEKEFKRGVMWGRKK